MSNLDSPEYKRLCETLALFCDANKLDTQARDHLSVLVVNAIYIGEEGKKELLEALKEMMAIARFHMRTSNGFEPDEWCDVGVSGHGSKYEKAFDVIAKFSPSRQ